MLAEKEELKDEVEAEKQTRAALEEKAGLTAKTQESRLRSTLGTRGWRRRPRK